MRKVATILLIGLMFFNWFGYRLVTGFMQSQANASLTARLDKNDYDESQLISIKISSNLPYYTNSASFERVDGQIEIAGVHYNYVKRRVFKDSLEFQCIPNEQKTKLASASNEFYKLVNDLRHTQKKSGENSSTKNPVTELYSYADAWALQAIGNVSSVTHPFISTPIASADLLPREMPPDFF